MKINNNDRPKLVKHMNDLKANTFYVDNEGDVHFTNDHGKLVGYFLESGRYVPWYDTLDHHDVEELRLTVFTGTVSN